MLLYRRPILCHSLLFLASAWLLACRDNAGPEPDPDLTTAAGIYVLESVSGRGPTAGSFVLTKAGRAERRVRYLLPSGGLSAEYIALGSFRLRRGGALDVRLSEDSLSGYVWRPRAKLEDDLLQIQHPDPADGPDIIEKYRRE